MKVLVVADVLGEENNGTTIACMNLVRYLRSVGDEVSILCADQDKKDKEGYYVVPNLNLGKFINNMVEKNGVSLAKGDKKVIEEALLDKDIVHIMMPFALGRATLKIAKKKGIPVTAGFHVQAENFTSHIKMMNVPLANRLTYKNFYSHFYKDIDAIHYPTEFIRDYFERVVKKKTNAYVISNGVNDLYRYQPLERKGPYKKYFNILFIGRYSKEKSHPLLIKAVARSKYKDNIQLIFAGQGPTANQIKKLSQKYKINPPIMKFYSRKDLVKVINQCDLYVHPAEIEIEAISCLEAITCGLVPIISNSKRSATKAFALTENNLFENNNHYDLAKKIDYWYTHPKEKKACSESYLGFTTRFDQTSCMKKMREMLETYTKPECYTSKKKYYYRDELNDDFAFTGITTKHNKVGFKYIHNNILFKVVGSFLYYVFAKPIVFCLNKIVYRQKFIGKKKLVKYRKQGYFIYANHTSTMGDAFTPNLLTKKMNYIIVNEDATSIPGIKLLVQMFGAIPVPYYEENINPFVKAIETRVNKNKSSVTIYPEAHIWPTYTGIRKFKSSSFRYPIDMDKPVFVLTNTYVKNGKCKRPRLITYVDGPFYKDDSLSRKDQISQLRNDVYQMMLSRAGEEEQVEQIRYIKVEK